MRTIIAAIVTGLQSIVPSAAIISIVRIVTSATFVVLIPAKGEIMPDVVVFRQWRGGDIIALFPEIPADIEGRYCQSYMQIGQHGAADYHSVIDRTTPVCEKRYVALAQELRQIGYELQPIRRATVQHHRRRRESAVAATIHRDTDLHNEQNTGAAHSEPMVQVQGE